MHVFLNPDLVVAAVCTLAGLLLARWTAALLPEPPRRRRVLAVIGVATAMIWVNALLASARLARMFDHDLVQWTRCAGIVCGFVLLYAALWVGGLMKVGAFQPGRRRALQFVAAVAAAAPVGIGSVAVIRRNELTFREVEIHIPSLPRDLDGLRIAQLTDIHLSPFVEEAALLRAVGMANETDPHLTFVTGDLISTKGDPLDKCIQHLATLRSSSGIWGCLGNHERYALAEDYTAREGERAGIRFLRHGAMGLRFGDATLNLVGVDYQRKSDPYLPGVESLVRPDAFNVLLTHNPDVFPVAVRKGFDLTVAGHTHGGQVTLEIVSPLLNFARFYTPYIYGLYERDGKHIYVSRGIGTIGVPARFGAPPEVALLRLRAGKQGSV